MLDDYQISQDRDLPKKVWDFMREKGFLGMVIPQEYGERLARLTWWTFATHRPVCFYRFSDAKMGLSEPVVPTTRGPTVGYELG